MTQGLDFHVTIINDLERSFSCLINGKRYEYYFADGNWGQIKATAKRLYNVSPGKSLAWIKKRCTSWELR